MSIIKTSTALAAAFVGLFAGTAHAQERLIANIPFPFVVQGQPFAAGHYDIRDDNGMLTLVGVDNNSGAFALTVGADGRDPAGSQPALVFTRYENAYRLSQVWGFTSEGFAVGQELVGAPNVETHIVASDAPTVVLVAGRK